MKRISELEISELDIIFRGQGPGIRQANQNAKINGLFRQKKTLGDDATYFISVKY